MNSSITRIAAHITRTATTILILVMPLVAGRVYAAKPNVLFIAIDDLRNDLGAFGAAHAKTPQLDAFAKSARVFTHHYVQVPTCGASRCALLRGRYPSVPSQVNNDGIKKTQEEWAAKSLPAVFRAAGYRTLSLGKISHHPGNRTGKDWAGGPEELTGAWDRAWVPDGPWKSPEAMMHGYADGAARRPGKSLAWQAHDGPDEAYPDAWIAADAVKTLRDLAEKKEPWFFGVGFFKPHLPFAAPKKWHDLHAAGVPDLSPEAAAKPSWPSGWHASGEFQKNYAHAPGDDPTTNPEYARHMRRAYAASISYMDAQVGRVLDELRRLDLEKKTIVVVWSDHGFLLGEHAIWGKHCLYEHALRSPFLLRHPGLTQPGVTCTATVETVDIFPTLAELCGIPSPTGLDGRSLLPQLADPAAPATKPAQSFWGRERTIRTERWRLTARGSKNAGAPQIELFDYANDPDETRNHAADHPELVADLIAKLQPSPIATTKPEKSEGDD
jgi:iduronate 2-sulfatase